MVDEVTEHGKCQRKPTGNPGFQSLNWWQHPSWEDSGCDSLTALTVYPVGRRKLYHLASFRHSPILQGGLGWLQCRRLRNERRSFFTREGTCLMLSARLPLLLQERKDFLMSKPSLESDINRLKIWAELAHFSFIFRVRKWFCIKFVKLTWKSWFGFRHSCSPMHRYGLHW